MALPSSETERGPALASVVGPSLKPEAERLERAIRFASFDEVSSQEKAGGFAENPGKSETFFTSGKAGKGREALGPELTRKIETDHKAVMKRFGYL